MGEFVKGTSEADIYKHPSMLAGIWTTDYWAIAQLVLHWILMKNTRIF